MTTALLVALALAMAPAKAPKAKSAKPPPPPVVEAPPCPEPPPPPPAQKAPSTVRVMLPDLDVSGRQRDARDALGQLVAAEAGRVKGYTLLSAAEVRAILDKEAGKQLAGCSETDCLAEIAQALDAELIVSGRIAETPDRAVIVSLSLVNARALVVVNRVNAVWRGEDNRIPDVVRTSAQLLLLPAKERPPGGVVLGEILENGRVFVDGVERTSDAQTGRLGGLEVGVHEVTLEAPDKITKIVPVVVTSGQDSSIDTALEDVSVPGALLVAGGVSAVVVGAALTATALYFAGRGDVTVSATVPDATAANAEGLRGIGK